MSSFIQQSFNTICMKAQKSTSHYVSLYCKSPYYGGPEEGGWWGTDVSLVAYMEFPSLPTAQRARELIGILSEELTSESRKEYGDQCLRETEWLESRGLDDSFLPEPDGPEEYFVTVEEELGASQSRGCRQYS